MFQGLQFTDEEILRDQEEAVLKHEVGTIITPNWMHTHLTHCRRILRIAPTYTSLSLKTRP
jgi:hypothetical protein